MVLLWRIMHIRNCENLIGDEFQYFRGNMVDKIRKRDGRIVEFDKSKIANAVFKAFLATKSKNGKKAGDIANQVVEIIEERIPGIPGVEDVQNIVEEVLIKNG